MKRSTENAFQRASRERLADLISGLSARRLPVTIVEKGAYWHQRLAGRLLWLLTLGGQNRYLTHYVTTLGHTIYVPEDFATWHPDHAYQVLRHELIHVAQFERLGVVGMVLVYGLLPLPAGLAYGRARLEWEAYRETLRAVAETEGLPAARSPALHAEIIRRFTGPDYGFMWPFPRSVRRWIHEALADL